MFGFVTPSGPFQAKTYFLAIIINTLVLAVYAAGVASAVRLVCW